MPQKPDLNALWNQTVGGSQPLPQYKSQVNFGSSVAPPPQPSTWDQVGNFFSGKSSQYANQSDEQIKALANRGDISAQKEMMNRAGSLGSFAKWLPGAAKATTDFVTDSTVKPLAKLGAAAPGALVANARAGYNAFKSGNLFNSQNDQNFRKDLSQPINVPWLGNINPYKQDTQTGGYNAGRSAVDLGAKIVDAGSGAYNLANPAMGTFKQAFTRGAIQSGAKAAQDENATPFSVGASALGGGLVTGTLAKAPDILRGARKTFGKLAGLSDETVSTLQNPELGGKVLSNVPQAESALKNQIDNLNPLQTVGQKEFKPALDKLYIRNKELGKEIGEAVKGSTNKVTLESPYNAFVSKVENLGGTVRNKSLSFGEFSPIDNPSEVKQLNNLFSVVNKYKNKEIPLSSLHDLVRKADNMLEYSGKSAIPLSSPAESAIRELRSTASDLLKKSLPTEQRNLFNQFSQNREILDFFNPKLGENSSSASLLKSLYSPARKDELLPMLQGLERQTRTKILDPTKVAKAAMDIAGDPRGDMLLGAVQDMGQSPKAGLLKALGRVVFNPKGRAKALVRSSQGLGVTRLLPQGLSTKANILPAATIEALRKFLNSY